MNMTKINQENVKLLRSLTGSSISLNDYVMAYYDSEILEFPKEKVDIIKNIVEESIQVYGEIPYYGRVNEMGNHMETCLDLAIKRLGLGSSKKLGTGYPDNCSKLTEFDYPIYMDPKVSSNICDYSGFRMFYTSIPAQSTKERKNISDGYHLLINYEHDGKNNLTGRYKITDLDGFVYYMVNKQEASAKDIYEVHNKVILQNLI